MHYQDARLSLADLCAAGLRLRPIEAVTIVREVALQVARGDVAGVPSPHVIRIAASGAVTIEGPVAAGGHLVSRAAQLLESLLPPFDAAPELRAPGALRLVVARGVGTLDLPPYTSLESFAAALARFAAPNPAALLRQVAKTWADAIALQQSAAVEGENTAAPVAVGDSQDSLTIADIRRARRATGLTLAEVSERSRIPVSLLRQLEWGYLLNWPDGQYGRTQLIRYARGSGLDAEIVVRAAWPLIEEAQRMRQTIASLPDTPAVPAAGANLADEFPIKPAEEPAVLSPDVVPAEMFVMPARQSRMRRLRPRWVAALAIPALLALGVLIPYAGRRNSVPVAATAPVERPTAAVAAAPNNVAPAAVHAGDTASVVAEPPSRPVEGVNQPDARAASQPDARAASEPLAPPATPNAPAERIDLATADRVFSPTFATEGSAMFYHAESAGGSALMRADTDSRGAVLRVTSIVNDRARNFHVRPSPDGERIAFDSDRDGERAVYIADADGRNVRRVSGEGFAAVPSWSPDGRMLAFVRSEKDRPRVWNLWTTDLETGEARRLTSHRVGQPWGGSWFPGGRRIAYSHERRLVVLDLDTLEQRVYPAPRPGLLRTPAVSPDGRRIMFQIHRDGAWMLDLKDGSMRKVLSDPSAEEFTWAPDGRRVAYHSRRSGTWGVWVMMAE